MVKIINTTFGLEERLDINMFIRLSDLISYIEDVNNMYFINLDTYEIYNASENTSVNDTKLFLQIPNIDINQVRSIFSEKYSKIKGRYKLKKALDNDNKFYNTLEQFELIDEWDNFKHEYLLKIAENWCNANNIICTHKELHEDISMQEVIKQIKSDFGS